MTAKTLMVQATTSDAGKSAVVTGLCRLLARHGVRVAPFKPQNMALNSAVTVDGGEIGRAQAVQAEAAGLEPHTDMNPVLLKPNTDIGAQVIIHGRVVANLDASAYHDYKPVAMKAVLASYQRLCRAYDVVLVEGAGSPAEINLRSNDIANMGFAEAVDCPVWLLGDIDRGGVFAHLLGTLALLSGTEQARIQGFIINRFRGDITLLEPGLEWLEQHTGKPVLGVLPYLQNLYLEAEDSLARPASTAKPTAALQVAVPVLARISNHTDLDPLRLHPQVNLFWVRPGDPFPPADLVVLPGSKSTRGDLERLRQYGWDKAIYRHLRYGGKVIGACGGFQMLGRVVRDPEGLEGPAGETPGLGLLDMETELRPHKQLRRVHGRLSLEQAPVSGYEIHMGITRGAALQAPAVHLETTDDGAISADGQILGTYLHGLFDHPAARASLLRWTGLNAVAPVTDYNVLKQAGIDLLADTLEAQLRPDALATLMNSDTRVKPSDG